MLSIKKKTLNNGSVVVITKNWPKELDRNVDKYFSICDDLCYDRYPESLFAEEFNQEFYEFLLAIKRARLVNFNNLTYVRDLFEPVRNIQTVVNILYAINGKTKKSSVSKLPLDLVRMLHGMFF